MSLCVWKAVCIHTFVCVCVCEYVTREREGTWLIRPKPAHRDTECKRIHENLPNSFTYVGTGELYMRLKELDSKRWSMSFERQGLILRLPQPHGRIHYLCVPLFRYRIRALLPLNQACSRVTTWHLRKCSRPYKWISGCTYNG